jgi:hypothetical protein
VSAGDVENLMQACADDERVLRHGARLLDPVRRQALELLAVKRHDFIESLRKGGKTTDHPPTVGGSLGGAFRDMMFGAWVFTVGVNTGDTFSSMMRSQERVENSLASAMKDQWSPDMLAAVTKEHARTDATRAELVAIQYN